MKNDAFKISDDIYAYGDGSKRQDQGHSLGKKEKLLLTEKNDSFKISHDAYGICTIKD